MFYNTINWSFFWLRSVLFLRGYCQRGIPLSCLYPPLTQTLFSMPIHTSFIPSENRTLSNNNDDLAASLTQQGYGDLVNANPWASLDYKQSGWQKFLGALGFRTGFDVAKENQQFQSAEYLSNIQAMATENQYNSPTAQAQRMRAAGLNPDIQGLGDVANSAELPEETNNELPNSVDDLGKAANVIMQGVSIAMGFAKDVGALKQISIANERGRLENADYLGRLADGIVLANSPDEMPISGSLDFDAYQDRANESALSFAPFLSKRALQSLNSEIARRWNNLPNSREKYAQWRDLMKNRQQAFGVASSELYSDQDEVLYAISEKLNKHLDAAMKKQAENAEGRANLEGLEIENAAEYQGAIDPSLSAAAENAVNAKNLQSDTMETDLNSIMADIVGMLKDKADHGSKFASIALIAFSVMRMMSFQMSSSKGFNPKGSFGSSSFGFGI